MTERAAPRAPRLGGLLAGLDAGFTVAGVALGAATFQLNSNTYACTGFRSGQGAIVLERYETALGRLWQQALEQLSAEATRQGAHGVIGVSARHDRVAAGVHQLQLSGTAVRARGADEVRLDRPFLALMDLSDTVRLVRSGWIPVGIGWGVAAVHVHSWGNNAFWQGTALSNAEMSTPTFAVQLVRSRAQASVGRSLAEVSGASLVGATLSVERVSQKCGNAEGSLVTASLLGTAIHRYRASPARPLVALDLQGRRP